MKVWLHAGLVPLRRLPALALAAEQGGYHGIALSDHAVWPRRLDSGYPYGRLPSPEAEYPDMWVTIAALAATTTRLRFVSKVYLAAARHPLVLARSVATAATLSHDRVELGVGSGWMREEFEIMDVDPDTRGARLDETIAVLRTVWREGWVEHHGRFFDFPPLRLVPAPRQPIPILGGGESPPALRRAAALDGWLGAAYELDRLAELIAALRRHRRDQEQPPSDVFAIVAGVPRVPTIEDLRRLGDLGVTGVSVVPWLGRPVTGGGVVAERAMHDAVNAFSETVLARD